MGKIIFKQDIDQDALITKLQSAKVEVSTFNSTVNNINSKINNLDTKIDNKFKEANKYTDDLINDLKDTDIKSLKDAIGVLNGDESVDGSVDKKIKDALTALINGAPEAYDTLKELLDFINEEADEFTNLVDKINNKIANLKGNVSDEWNTLEKIEKNVINIKSELDNKITETNNDLSLLQKSIPIYKYDNELPIDENNKIVLSYKPFGDLVNGSITVYDTDDDGNITIISKNTYKVDEDDSTGRTYIIESDDNLDEYKAAPEYFYREIDQN